MLLRLRDFAQTPLVVLMARPARGNHIDGETELSAAVWKKARALAQLSIWTLPALLWLMAWSAPAYADEVNTQIAQLYELQAAFHRAASVHSLNGDSPDVINQRIRDMLSLWTEDGSLTLSVGGSLDGTYAGRGDPENPGSCPAPSSDFANRGTLCTFFTYVAGSFQPQNKFVSLAPAYKTQFDVQGNTASVYFECHYFNVATDPTTVNPLWTAASHVTFDGSASKVNGNWLFSQANAYKPGVPIP
jgi:hypothetical protein